MNQFETTANEQETERERIGFALLSNSEDPIPSTRIACLNLFPYLRSAGFDPEILFDPATPSETPEVSDLVEKALDRNCKVVVFQKIRGPSVIGAVRRLRHASVRTVYCVCDLVDDEMAAAVDATIVVTDFLRSLYRPELHHRIHVVHDGIERPDLSKEHELSPSSASKEATFRAILVTSQELYTIPVLGVPPRGWEIDLVGRFADNQNGMQLTTTKRALAGSGRVVSMITTLRTLLHPRIRRIAWHPDGVYGLLLKSDVGIIPIDTSRDLRGSTSVPSWKVKSENRLTLMMGIGLPVIATPIPAYEQVIEHGVNGFLARSRRDWLACLSRLRDPDLRRHVGIRARHAVLGRYSLDLQAELFLAILWRLISDSALSVQISASEATGS